MKPNKYWMLCLALSLGVAHAAEPDEVATLKWEALVPADYPLDQIYQDMQVRAANVSDGTPEEERLHQELREIWAKAPVVAALDGKTVRIGGYVVPFEGDGHQANEFLLVTSFGTCIHVPPPTANQTVYVVAPKETKSYAQLTPVWVTGVLRTQAHANALADAGYTLIATKVEEY